MRRKLFDKFINFELPHLFLASLLLTLFLASCASEQQTNKEKSDQFSWAISQAVIMAPVWIAREKDFFRRERLEPVWKVYNSGVESCTALLKGEAQVANCSDFAFVNAASENPSLRIIASHDRGLTEQIVARKDFGIKKISDLVGKRIGLVKNSSSEFYLYFTLQLEQIPLKSLHIIDLSPPEQIEALIAGSIDAILVWKPYSDWAAAKLENNAITWAVGEGIDSNWLLVSTKDFVENNPSITKRIIKSLLYAEDYMQNNQSEVISVLKQKHDIQENINFHQFRITLDRPLLVALETQARWLRKKQPEKFPIVPNYLTYMSFSILEDIAPDRIKLSY